MNIKQLMYKFIKDKDGNIVIWQTPNAPLLCWVGIKLILAFIPVGHLKTGLTELSSAVLLIWSYLELSSGESYFRKLLGLVVMVSTIIGFFR